VSVAVIPDSLESCYLCFSFSSKYFLGWHPWWSALHRDCVHVRPQL